MTRARHRLFDAKRRDGLTTRMEDNQMRREYRGFITIPGMRPIPAYLFPAHDAMRGCRSGRRDHCTCDGCF